MQFWDWQSWNVHTTRHYSFLTDCLLFPSISPFCEGNRHSYHKLQLLQAYSTKEEVRNAPRGSRRQSGRPRRWWNRDGRHDRCTDLHLPRHRSHFQQCHEQWRCYGHRDPEDKPRCHGEKSQYYERLWRCEHLQWKSAGEGGHKAFTFARLWTVNARGQLHEWCREWSSCEKDKVKKFLWSLNPAISLVDCILTVCRIDCILTVCGVDCILTVCGVDCILTVFGVDCILTVCGLSEYSNRTVFVGES